MLCVHVILCFSLTPTAIDLGNLQQPSSVVHSNSRIIQPLNTQRKYRKKQVSVQHFGGKLLHANTSRVRVSTCNRPVIRRGEVSTLPIQRVRLTPDVSCLQCTSWMQVYNQLRRLLPDVSPLWDKPAGLYLIASRSINRLSEVPTLQPLLLLNMPSAVATPLPGMRP